MTHVRGNWLLSFVAATLSVGVPTGFVLPAQEARKQPARPSPGWLRAGVIYEINPRAFSPSGSFQAITARLGELEGLGVNVLWIMPVHPAGRDKRKGSIGSPSAVRDYHAIDPAYGTAADFHALVGEAHRRGLKVILDIVANHTAWDSVLMKNTAFYKRDPSGRILSPEDWTDVAALDYSNPELRQYMLGMLEHWVREFDLDGFRCDVAGMVPVSFWEQARDALDKLKPGLILLAEWHDPVLLRKAFDLDYSWPLHARLTEVFENGSPAAELRKEWEEERRIYPAGALHLRFSDNHDEKRAIARFGERGALAASAFMFTLDGAPLLYNGMEAGDTTESGAPALFERLPIFWPMAERRPEFPAFYRSIIALRRAHPALQQGATVWLDNSDPARILTYTRQGADEEFLIAINCSNRPFQGRLTIAPGVGWAEVLASPAALKTPIPPQQLPALALDAWGYRIFRRKYGERPGGGSARQFPHRLFDAR